MEIGFLLKLNVASKFQQISSCYDAWKIFFPLGYFCYADNYYYYIIDLRDTYTNQSTANSKDTSSVGMLITLHNITTKTIAADGIAAEDMLAAVQANLSKIMRYVLY